MSILLSWAAGFSASAGDWPQWRGPARDGHATPGANALTSLPKEPKTLWRLSIGPGHSSPVVAQGKLIYLDEQNGRETAHLLEAQTGREIWRNSFAESIRDEWGAGPRSTPVVDGDRVFVQSCRGELRCLRLEDGQVIWGASYLKDFGVVYTGNTSAAEDGATRRGHNGCGVVEGGNFIAPAGGANGASIVCFNKFNGQVVWKSQSDPVAYSSLLIARLAGRRQVVAFTAEALMGLDTTQGELLWRVPLKTMAKRHVLTPVIAGDSIMVGSHTFGVICVKITAEGNGLKATQSWLNRDLRINLATPVAVGNHLYGLGPAKDFVCVKAASGELAWTKSGFGDYASTFSLGQQLLVLTDRGELLLLAADPAQYRELGRVQVCGKTWAFPAYVDGRLYVRDGRELACLDLCATTAP